MYGQRRRGGGTQRGQQQDGQHRQDLALDVVPDVQHAEHGGQKKECHVLQKKIRRALNVVQAHRADDQQDEQQGESEHVAGQQAAQ